MNFLKRFQMRLNAICILKTYTALNNHHIIESCFKAFARSLRIAVEIDEKIKDIIPSSKRRYLIF